MLTPVYDQDREHQKIYIYILTFTEENVSLFVHAKLLGWLPGRCYAVAKVLWVVARRLEIINNVSETTTCIFEE